MYQPNFCEAQLQLVTNIELYNLLANMNYHTSIPFIPSLVFECELGWDTAFCFPWIKNVTSQGYNFFIQYKLSNLYDYSCCKTLGRKYWKEDFYRFNLGYRKGKNIWDFHQRDSLIKLAQEGFMVIYISNHITELSELINLAASKKLCTNLPVLRVDDALANHKYVSFTTKSNHFCLHSKISESSKLTIEKIMESIDIAKQSVLTEDIPKLKNILLDFERSNNIQEGGLEQRLKDFPEKNVRNADFLITRLLLHRYLNVHWFRIYKAG